MEFFLPGIYLLLVGVALVFILLSIRDFGKSSLGVGLGYFFVATIILGAIRGLFFLADEGILAMDEDTLMVVWHGMFYIAVAIMLLSSYTLESLATRGKKSGSWAMMVFWGALAVFATVALCFLAEPIRRLADQSIGRTLLHEIGVLHLIAFIFAGLVARYLFRLRRQYAASLGEVVLPVLISVGVLSFIHLWELLTENWGILHLPGETIELVEAVLWVPVYAGLTFGFWRLRQTQGQ